jgi:uncharacterized protein (DUF302 family)
MTAYGRRITVDTDFETSVSDVNRALREEGLQVIARIDVRDHFWQHARQSFRRYELMDVWSPELALEALRHDLDVGAMLATTFAVYELTDRRAAIVVNGPLSPEADEPGWRAEAPALAAIADRERERIARVLARLERHERAPIADAA